MAKYGEGDKRWIVEERSDGTNVHNWHWSETDCLEWSRNLLTKLLSDLTLLDGEGNLFVRTKKVEKVDGEAYVNIRKGKIIPGYEISVVLAWEGEARDSDGKSLLKVDGTVEIPYIADENADEDPEVKVLVKDDGPIGRRLKEAMGSRGKPVILEKVRVFVESMARGGPAREDLETKKVAPIPKNQTSSPAEAAAPAAAGKKEVAAAPEKKEVKKKKKEGFKTISMTEKFSCRARDMYEILMDENRWKGFTQSNARISKEVGGEFSIFDGSVTGRNVELQEGKLIVQQWRFGSWPDGIHSTVKLTLDEPESGLTVVKLTHTDVPEEDRYGNATVVENTERGWRDLIFNKIRAVFGFGI
ncbi:activator of 90 kDa heat shock protein ATPase homolog 1 [Rhodamnia argentea]|uniref:Activator of 90 kDa heat shock protein ATPase homolog 1 n=1 Tax=Rhodamnia argentea TaxID=178133 RepID=A0A8B8N169_9MYRT|nr:activator of 90 kDa heat shock protein ATPase homolog 1 [Rhodamnia argentea]